MTASDPSVERFAQAVGGRLDGTPLVVMLDIDGTIAAIARRPENVVVPDSTKALLKRLSSLPGVIVTLVSGRSVADALRVAGVDGIGIIGNHGFETRAPDGTITARAEAHRYESAVAAAAAALASIETSVPGSIVENKRWTLSVHYRLVDPSAVAGIQSRVEDVARATGLRVTEGKKVYELRPPLEVNKGTAVLAHARSVGARTERASLLYAGDDRTDEDAFEMLRASEPRAVTIRVGSGAGEPSPRTKAELSMSGPEELQLALTWLATRRAQL